MRKIHVSRKLVFLGAAIGLFFGAVAMAVSVQLPVREVKRFPAPSYVADELLVKFKPHVAGRYKAQAIEAYGDRHIRELTPNGYVHVKLKSGVGVSQAMTLYKADPNIESVQPNYIYHATLAPNDAQYDQLWAFKNIGQTIASGTYTPTNGTAGEDMNIEPAWDHITDCSGVVVAVIDSGVNYNQEDLASNMWSGNAKHGWDYVDGDNDPMDLNGHGTHVAGIIGAAGNNSLGTSGVCWKASIMAVRVLDATGSGDTLKIIDGIEFAVANGAKVINMSLSGGGAFDLLFSEAITNAQSQDVMVIVAAGNDTNDNDDNNIVSAHYPCNFTHANLICVAALDQNYALANFSNWGATSVDVGAPGTNVLSTWAGSKNTIADNFNTSGALDWTTSGGWAYALLALSSGGSVDALVNPSTFPSGTYNDNVDNRVYKSFNLSGNDVATLQFFTQFAVQASDIFSVNYRSDGGDPFAGGGVTLASTESGGDTTQGFIVPVSFDISPCVSATCSVGFQLLTDVSGTDQGVGILGFGIETLALNTDTYNTTNGTSMASPVVAGLATMLRAFNPQYTYTDVVNAIKNGARPLSALAGKTTTGKAVDASEALAYINPPTGVTAVIQ